MTAREMTWPQRVLYGVLGLVLLVLAFFFLTIALVAGALIALVVLGRLWWISRKVRRETGNDALEGEYRVVPGHDAPEDRMPRP